MTSPVSSFAAPVPGATPVQPAGQTSVLTSDFDTFLKMLTAQAKNQDPLEPIDSSEYAAQLAQFSMVEQQVKTNDTLTALFGQMGLTNMASLAGWVGMEARAATPAYFDGSPITISPNPASLADEAYLVVKDETGTQVQRTAIPVSADPIEWAGVDDSGAPFANGVYSFTVESYAAGSKILTEQAEVFGRIVEAQVQGGNTILILPGRQAVLATTVTALREPI